MFATLERRWEREWNKEKEPGKVYVWNEIVESVFPSFVYSFIVFWLLQYFQHLSEPIIKCCPVCLWDVTN